MNAVVSQNGNPLAALDARRAHHWHTQPVIQRAISQCGAAHALAKQSSNGAVAATCSGISTGQTRALFQTVLPSIIAGLTVNPTLASGPRLRALYQAGRL